MRPSRNFFNPYVVGSFNKDQRFPGKMHMAVKHALESSPGSSKRRVFWDVEHREPDRCSRPLMGEERMWAAALILAIQDAKGVSLGSNKECLECHKEEHPSCFKFLKRAGEEYALRVNKSCSSYHTRQQCAIRWFASDSIRYGYRGKGEDSRGTFVGVCTLLSINPSYLRRCLQEGRFDEYWQDEAKVNSFLGFHTGVEPSPKGAESLDDTGSSGETGESD